MASKMERSLEHGSFFHLIFHPSSQHSPHPWDKNARFFGSGRDAFRQLLGHGRSLRGWKRLFVPSYFCQDVVRSFISTGIEVVLYADGPSTEAPEISCTKFRMGDVLLRMNFFGIRTSFPIDIDREMVEVIDDHTHDPWSDWAWNSDADWCIASFRKVLPIPDGGVMWSPHEHQMPQQPPVTDDHRLASLERLGAMALRALYLDGQSVEKDIFRRLSASAEDHMDMGPVSGLPEWSATLLQQFPVQEWREKRRENVRILNRIMDGLDWLKLLKPEDDTKTCPFGGTLVFDTTERRDYVRMQLIEHRVYLPVLWDMETPAAPGIPEEHLHLSRCIASVPCDMRYTRTEVEQVGQLIRELGEVYGAPQHSGQADALALVPER